MDSTKTAILIGATGLVGSHLLMQLLDDDRYKKVEVFTRRTTGVEHPKLEEHIVEFREMKKWKDGITGNDLYSCLGTTLKKAGGKKNQWRIDYTYQYDVAKAASENGVKTCVLCSSAGANPKSKLFYLRMKGELDRDVQNFDFERIMIMKPSTLGGERNEKRQGEKFFFAFSNLFTWLPFLKKYKVIPADIVARAMINAANSDTENRVKEYEFLEVFKLAG